jgi:uncharacterized protein YbjT (DUF2867 family)
MSQPMLVTGAAGGIQGSTGHHVATLLMQQGLKVRAFVHKLDARSADLHEGGAEIVEGDLLKPESVRMALKGIRRAYFTYPVAEGLLEATTIFAAAARDVGVELIINNSQLQNTPDAPSFRNLQHRLADQILGWAHPGVVHLHAPPYFENLRALIARSVAEQASVFLPWGNGSAVFPMVSAEDVSRVAAALLSSSSAPSSHAYHLIGETLTVNAIIDTLGRVLQKRVRYVAISDEQWIEAVKGRTNVHALDHLSNLWRYFRTSGTQKNDKEFRVTESIRQLTGREPLSLEQFFRNNVEALGGLRRIA